MTVVFICPSGAAVKRLIREEMGAITSRRLRRPPVQGLQLEV